MPRILAVVLAAAALALAVSLPVTASEPSSGVVSGAAPQTTWTGDVTGEAFTAINLDLLNEAGGTHGVCEAPLCDTFTLTVGDPGTKLTVQAVGATEDDYTAIEIEDPDGTATWGYDSSNVSGVSLANPKAGEYIVRVLGAQAIGTATMTYKGTATLEGAAAPEPSPTPTPTSQSTPQPTPEPTPSPAPPASPPAQAGPRTLAIELDRRRVARAVRKGFRVRTLCQGGCATLKLRVYVSSLTARQLRLGRYTGDVQVGEARILREAEGRRQALVRFRGSLRRYLRRARRLSLAVEAVATDPDGEVRMLVKRVTLRR